jgi:hypothetical protein
MRSVTFFCLMVAGCLCLAHPQVAHAGHFDTHNDSSASATGGDGGDASATGVGVGIAGAAAGAKAVNRNSNTATNTNFNSTFVPVRTSQGQGQEQGQGQGQLQGQGQDQGQGQVQGNLNIIEGDEAPNIPKPAAASPAAVYVDMCSGGASLSTPGGGATIGGGDNFCKKIALAEAFFRHNMPQEGVLLLIEAHRDLDRQTAVSSKLDWIPVVGRLF